MAKSIISVVMMTKTKARDALLIPSVASAAPLLLVSPAIGGDLDLTGGVAFGGTSLFWCITLERILSAGTNREAPCGIKVRGAVKTRA
ncbi:hypothetical protein AVEN_14432-1 [Araneus ventricosus]|uniref:Uncharacterized protein n=1 Tax=Araneus ventricosus TaxID=182803 RepID=A0A4Y2SXR1_ARAVE|nr:hypothetical protein AVEN_14432-1 [Araneus ventricosus]